MVLNGNVELIKYFISLFEVCFDLDFDGNCDVMMVMIGDVIEDVLKLVVLFDYDWVICCFVDLIMLI